MRFSVNEEYIQEYFKLTSHDSSKIVNVKTYAGTDGQLLLRSVSKIYDVIKEEHIPYQVGDMCLFMYSVFNETSGLARYNSDKKGLILDTINFYLALPVVICSLTLDNVPNKVKLLKNITDEECMDIFENNCSSFYSKSNVNMRKKEYSFWFKNWNTFDSSKDNIKTLHYDSRIIDAGQLEACGTSIKEQALKLFISYPYSIGMNSTVFVSDVNELKKILNHFDPKEDKTPLDMSVFNLEKENKNTFSNKIKGLDGVRIL